MSLDTYEQRRLVLLSFSDLDTLRDIYSLIPSEFLGVRVRFLALIVRLENEAEDLRAGEAQTLAPEENG